MKFKNKMAISNNNHLKNKSISSGFMKPLVSLFIFLNSIFLKGFGQETFSYTQYMLNPLPLNSAASLQDERGNLDLLARKQWQGINGAPATFFIDGSLPIKSLNGAVGIIAENDKFGPENLTEFNFFYAQGVKIGDNQVLGLSLSLGDKIYTANYSAYNPIDPALTPNINQNKPNLGFSLLYYSPTKYIGFSVPELILPNLGNGSISNNNYFRKNYFIMGGFTTKVAKGILFKPSALISYTRGFPIISDITGLLSFKNTLGVGLDYKTNNEIALILSYDFDYFRIGYSYQSSLASQDFGGLVVATQELTIKYYLSKKNFDLEKAKIKRVF
jgi:type IX secretion system PorP/SprF family membrane protein